MRKLMAEYDTNPLRAASGRSVLLSAAKVPGRLLGSAGDSRLNTLVVHTDEELVIARETVSLIGEL